MSKWFILLSFLILSACSKEKTDSLASFKQVPLPENLTRDTADLVVEGTIGKKSPVFFDLQTIMDFPQSSFVTYDPWDDCEQRYTGVLLSALLEYLEISDMTDHIQVNARNDYSIPISIHDIKKYEYLLAYKIDDNLFQDNEKTQNKGLLIIAINFSKDKEIEMELYKHQLVWQVFEIVVQ